MKIRLTSIAFCLALVAALSVAATAAQPNVGETSLGAVKREASPHTEASSSVAPPAPRFAPDLTRKAHNVNGAISKSKSHRADISNSKNKKSLHKKRTPTKKAPNSKKKIGMV
jgi:hypothetical protein